MLQFIVVHDSDEVHDVIAADNKSDLFKAIMKSTWKNDIVERLEDEDIEEEDITLDNIINTLYHDGDSEVGYTLK